ncbi:DUF4886 domain-containing protein [candidate division KSB1 bacterium]
MKPKWIILESYIFKIVFQKYVIRTLIYIILLTGILNIQSCQNKSSTGINDPESDEISVLFFGNSLTHWNNMTSIFEELAESAGKEIYVDAYTPGGWRLSNHAESGITESKIYERDWDFIVLQGSKYEIAFLDLLDTIYPPIITLVDMIRDNNSNTNIVFFLDYALKNGITRGTENYTYAEFQEMLFDGTKTVADSLDMIIAPVGWAWKTVMEEKPSIELYDLDSEHPSANGSYIMACVYYATICYESIYGADYYQQINSDTASYLQEVSSETVLDNLALWNIK